MSQLEQEFYRFLSRNPDIKSALSKDVVNIRSLARLFSNDIGTGEKGVEASVAMIRRLPLSDINPVKNSGTFSGIKITIRDEITIFDFEKSKEVMEKIRGVIPLISYDRFETLKVVVGTHTIKVIVDTSNIPMVKEVLGKHKLLHTHKNISEASLLFSDKALDEKGIISYVSSELLNAGITIKEIMTCTPELIIYIEEAQSTKAFEVLKSLKGNRVNEKNAALKVRKE